MRSNENKYPSIWQIVDTYGIRKMQNDDKTPTRLLVSISLAERLWRELLDNGRRMIRPSIGQHCTDFLGMGVRIVGNGEIEGDFEIDYVPIEHKPYCPRRDGNANYRYRHYGFAEDFWREFSRSSTNSWYGFNNPFADL